MAEQLTLTTPITPTPIATWKIARVILDVPSLLIQVEAYSPESNTKVTAFYPTPSPGVQPSGQTLLHALNTGNFTTNSLIKITLQRLQSDGYLDAGSVTGTPE